VDNSADIIFRFISFTVFTVTIASVALLSVFRTKKVNSQKEVTQFKLISIQTLKKLICAITFLSSFVLIITGFFHPLVLSRTISGYWLMLHVTAAAVFVCCLTLFALMYAEENLLKKPAVLRAMTFWLILLLALPLILSIILSMFPLFGTHHQELLAEIHRYSALSIAIIIIIHFYLASFVARKTE
jgi:hypothetical protein